MRNLIASVLGLALVAGPVACAWGLTVSRMIVRAHGGAANRTDRSGMVMEVQLPEGN